MLWWSDGIVCRFVAVPTYDLLQVSTSAGMSHDVLDDIVLPCVFHFVCSWLSVVCIGAVIFSVNRIVWPVVTSDL